MTFPVRRRSPRSRGYDAAEAAADAAEAAVRAGEAGRG
jgi:hypothetical protein